MLQKHIVPWIEVIVYCILIYSCLNSYSYLVLVLTIKGSQRALECILLNTVYITRITVSIMWSNQSWWFCSRRGPVTRSTSFGAAGGSSSAGSSGTRGLFDARWSTLLTWTRRSNRMKHDETIWTRYKTMLNWHLRDQFKQELGWALPSNCSPELMERRSYGKTFDRVGWPLRLLSYSLGKSICPVSCLEKQYRGHLARSTL